VVAVASRGLIKLETSDFKGAIKDFTKTLSLSPSSAILMNRGVAKNKIDDIEGAIMDYTEAINLGSHVSGAYSFRGGSKNRLRDFKGAIADCDEAIRLDPNSYYGYANKAVGRQKLGDYHGAFEDLSQAINIDPSNAGAFDLLADLCYDWKFELNKVVCCYRICALIEPNNPGFLWKVANAYMEWNGPNDIADEEFLLSLGPYSEECENFYIGEIAFKQKEQIAQGFYARAFVNSVQTVRTDIDMEIERYRMVLFVPQSARMLSSLTERMFYFSDARSFADKSDCPLLHEINQTDLIENVVYDSVRVRCFCRTENIEELYKMWADYVNHEGIAIRLNIDKAWLIENGLYSNNIKYTDKNEIEIRCDSPEQVIQDGLFIKHDDHSMENEWRLVKFGDFEKNIGVKVLWDYKDTEHGLGVEVEAVYLGMDISESSKIQTLKLAKQNSFDLYQMKSGPKSTLITDKIDSKVP